MTWTGHERVPHARSMSVYATKLHRASPAGLDQPAPALTTSTSRNHDDWFCNA